ncbi:hypothetical protein C2S53_019474 [Perilla frutescens var. hirtella]|uniref:RNA helicase n=1 Tax=Perilla frutescens var. hirtella TaxID=608512 RepID=A0AAD4J6U9_PERFH|nr:hypothetical protein C2S53_019474 [Perilla frutescens var. hirtella]
MGSASSGLVSATDDLIIASVNSKSASGKKVTQTLNYTVYKFEDNLTNKERAELHVLCRKMGLKSKSHGKSQERRICVYKVKKELSIAKGRENLASFRFSGESKAVLLDLFSQYPPNNVDTTENKVDISSGKIDNVGVHRDDFFCRPATNHSDIASKVQSLASQIEKESSLRQINTFSWSKLPIASFKDVITSTVDSNQVVLVCGETGCGKTTQVPQFLLDHAWSKGDTCKIICTQPSAVAGRIASERGENIGNSVGYKVGQASELLKLRSLDGMEDKHL